MERKLAMIRNNGKPLIAVKKPMPNDKCHCKSGKKYKHCCKDKFALVDLAPESIVSFNNEKKATDRKIKIVKFIISVRDFFRKLFK